MSELKTHEKSMYEDMDNMSRAVNDFENALTKRTQEWEKRTKNAKKMAGARGKMASLVIAGIIGLLALFAAYQVFIK